MALDGKWTLTLQTPMGAQNVTADFKSDGETLTGALNSPMLGVANISNGKVDGDSASWQMSITQPMAMVLDFTCKVSGDQLSGAAKAPMGSFPFTGAKG